MSLAGDIVPRAGAAHAVQQRFSLWAILQDNRLYRRLATPRDSRLLAFTFVALPVLALLVFHLGPILQLGHIGLMERYPLPVGEAPVYTSRHIARIFVEPLFSVPLLRTLILAATTSFLTLLVALPVSWLLIRHVAPTKRYRRILLILLPFWAGELVRVFSLVLFAGRKGPVNVLLQELGLIDAPIDILYTPGAIAAGMFYFLILYQILPLYAAIEKLPVSLSEAAADLGAGPWLRFRRITLPLLRPAIASGTTLVFLMSLGAYSVPLLLGGTGSVTFSEAIASAFNSGRDTWPIGAALSLILLVAGAVAGGLWLKILTGPQIEIQR